MLVVEDSPVTRQLLEHIIGGDPRFEIAAAVATAEEALRIVDRVAPDVISMDIRLPGMNGFEATERIMRARPTPVVVVSAADGPDAPLSMNALRAGALTVLEKPRGVTSAGYHALAERLCTQLALMSEVKVIRRHADSRPLAARHPLNIPTHTNTWKILGIVASTGGPNALLRLLDGFGPAFPLPILLVQHIARAFLEGFASWLESVTSFHVELVRDRAPLEAGKIYMAAPDRHLVAAGNYAVGGAGPPVGAQCPSGTVLFESMSASFGPAALGILLTGMGDDGALGLLRLRQSGGWTIAEDESTAVVYGMPAEAVRLGAVSESLPLPAIAPRILSLMREASEAAG
ncbi:MAG TPA: chemotaxis protein CheB [Bryobacteraceae bacterium]|nr:chemotaxis protein CheB [Bryobacteraceae bacterium]